MQANSMVNSALAAPDATAGHLNEMVSQVRSGCWRHCLCAVERAVDCICASYVIEVGA